jgi:malonate-semialdehyde dehydrogenase (acetylating) / methylmalonate-semialdehyde dehydrogenase
MATTTVRNLQNFIGGEWRASQAREQLDVPNPATGEVLARVPAGAPEDVQAAVRAAAAAFPGWRRTPPEDRIQLLFRFKRLLEEHFEELARTITIENGKTLAESRGEVQRSIENVEVACGIPSLMQGYNLEDIAAGIDEIMIRQPLGVVAAITPFNFPAMVPLWFLPYAIACGNTFILKPSERVPLSPELIFQLLEQAGLPPGVATLLHGAKPAVDGLLDDPAVRAISFVGSSPIAKYIYVRSAENGKRVQCQGGAKNYVVIMPDADMDIVTRTLTESAFGCAGQRCLAASIAVTVGDTGALKSRLVEAAESLRVGNGLEAGVQMGPVITRASKARIEGLIAQGASEGAVILVDGRNPRVAGGNGGNFLKPTILDSVPATSGLHTTEIFGPVLSLSRAKTLDDAIEILAQSPYGNAASIFTTSGSAARRFRYDAAAGNIGVNLGVAAPMAFFPFSGWKGSFFGVVHGQGRDAVEFYTEKKVVIERW